MRSKDIIISFICVALGGMARVFYCWKYPVPVRDAFRYKEFIVQWIDTGIIPEGTYFPPLGLYLLKIPGSLCGYDIMKGGIVVNMILGLSIILILIKISSCLYPSALSVLCTGLLAAGHPTLIQYSCQMTRENTYLFFSCLAVLFTIKNSISSCHCFILLVSLFSAAAFLCRFEALELVPLVNLAIFLNRKKNIAERFKQSFLYNSFYIIFFNAIIYLIHVQITYFLDDRYLKKFMPFIN